MRARKFEGGKEPVLALCEGEHDRELLTELLNRRGIGGIEVWSNETISGHGGNGAFGHALDALAGGAIGKVRAIVIVTDCDSDPGRAFAAIQEQIRGATIFEGPPARSYPVPNRPYEYAEGNPAIAVILIPGTDRSGALETLCLDAARQAAPTLADCVDAFAVCAGVPSWQSENRRDKMRFRSLIAAGYEANPEISPTRFWSEGPGHTIVPLDHAGFDRISDFLCELSQHFAASSP